MSRGRSGTRVVAWTCNHLGLCFGSSAWRRPSGDPTDARFTRAIMQVALASHAATRCEQVRASDLEHFQRAAFAFHRRLRPGARGWGWKFPETYLIGPVVLRAFPNARFIHLVRDGRDVAFKQHLTDDLAWPITRQLLRGTDYRNRPRHLNAAVSWARQVEQFEAFKSEIPPAQLLELRFEALCQAPLAAGARIASFLGLPLTPRCRDYLAKEVDAKRAGQFVREDPGKLAEVTALLAPTLERLGYL